MTAVAIRPPEPGETPLSHAERWIAIREGIHAATWHPALTRNWSVMSAKLHRAQAVAALHGDASGARAHLGAAS